MRKQAIIKTRHTSILRRMLTVALAMMMLMGIIPALGGVASAVGDATESTAMLKIIGGVESPGYFTIDGLIALATEKGLVTTATYKYHTSVEQQADRTQTGILLKDLFDVIMALYPGAESAEFIPSDNYPPFTMDFNYDELGVYWQSAYDSYNMAMLTWTNQNGVLQSTLRLVVPQKDVSHVNSNIWVQNIATIFINAPVPVVTKYTVTFDSAGGTAVGSQEVEAGMTAEKPANPTMTGYTFLGWFLEGDEYLFSSAVIGNITLTAKWSTNGSGGGGGETQTTTTVPTGDGTISVSFTMSGGVATLTLPDSMINEIIENAEDQKAVFDLSEVTNATAAVVPKEALAQLADAELAVEVILPQGTVILDNDAAASIAKQANGTSLTMALNQVNQSTLTAEQKEAVKPGDLVFNIAVTSGSQVITNFDGTITVSVPYSGPVPVAVWYLNANGELVKLESVYDTATKTVTFVTNHLSLYVVRSADPQPITPTMPVNPFSDVFGTDWFIDDVIYAYSIGLIDGVTPTTFAPKENLTYAQTVKLAACMHQLYTSGGVTLKNGSPVWYQSYVDYAKENGIIIQDYEWGAPATRAGYIEIFANALPDEAFDEINDIGDGAIPDVDSEHPQADAIYKLYRAGILQGVDKDYNCSPETNIKRSEVAAILTRMMKPEARLEYSIT